MEKKFIGNIVGVDGGTKKQRSDVYEMSFWFIDNYLARHRSLDIDIWLRPAKDIDDCHGFVERGDNGRQHYEIELNKELKGDDFTTLVFHELTHVLQYAKGLLKDLNKKGTKVWWRGFQYENFDYYKQPWERQAYRKQETINKAWKEYVKTRKKKILTIDVK
jgi:hypothetical protein|tara:strand:+ start:1121 stop:1606 length:486 start_codon:yes stop_codon:yes gene_type:complete